MTDPQRIAERGGFAARLLQAGAEEQPDPAGVSRTLAALGISGAVLTSSAAVGAVAAGSKVSSAVSGGAVAISTGGTAAASGASALLVVKWIGVGLLGGMSFAGAASIATRPTPSEPAAATVAPRIAVVPPRVSTAERAVAPVVTEAAPELAPSSVVAPALRPSLPEPPSPLAETDPGAPLSAEVAFVDRGRGLLRAGRTVEGLALLESYEQQFSEARLLPEVLFLRLEACERLGRTAEARRVAERLLKGFPKSPHAARARKLLEK